MTGLQSLSALLPKIQSSLESAQGSIPTAESALPPANGISLLDVKAELFLAYLQNLVFFILVKLRNHNNHDASSVVDGDHSSNHDLADEAVKKLVELRVYLERGVRPLEGRLKYQIDKAIRAADTVPQKQAANGAIKGTKAKNGRKKPASRASASNSGSDYDEKRASSAASSNSDAEDSSDVSIDELAYRPNPAAFIRPQQAQKSRTKDETSDDIYRPPRVMPTAMPTTDANHRDSIRRAKPLRSEAVDEYISHELSNAPAAEPSVGSTIVAGGRRNKSAKERQVEEERRAYEESNFVRLPKESKKERAKKRTRQNDGGFGGEELRGLGEGAERITKATAKRSRLGGGGRLTEDGPRGDGFAVGTSLGKKRRKLGR